MKIGKINANLIKFIGIPKPSQEYTAIISYRFPVNVCEMKFYDRPDAVIAPHHSSKRPDEHAGGIQKLQISFFIVYLQVMLKRTVSVFALLLALVLPVHGQYYLTGSAPSGTRWSQLKGDHFTLIYPSEIDSLARNYLFLFEKWRDPSLTGLRIETPRMPVILHPYNMNSNGMVAWAPRRVELYTTPPGDALYALDWPTQLAVHEGRHIGQMTFYTKHSFRLLNILFGEQGSTVGIGLQPSRTLFEGDAVQNETDLTSAGRGRNPDFLKYFRAEFLTGENRTFNKWKYDSFRYYSPGKYPIGYMIMSTIRDNSGNYSAAGGIIEGQSRNWWHLFNVSRKAYQSATGLSGGENWLLAVAVNSRQWLWEYYLHAPYTSFQPLLAEREPLYTEISNPVRIGSDTYAAMQGMQYERRMVRIDSLGRRHFQRPLSYYTSPLVADSDHSLIFSEIVPDPRWEQRSWSVIRRYDTRTRTLRTLTRRSRYVNPTPSPGRDSILAAEYPVEGGSNVVILDRDGALLSRIPAPDNGQVTGVVQLRQHCYASVITGEGIGLYRYDGSWEPLIAPQPKMIRNLQAAGDSLLYFVSDLDGLSNVYTFDPEQNALRRRTSARFSADSPSFAADGTLYYGDYDRLGYQPVAVSADSLDRVPADFSRAYKNALADRNSEQAAAHTDRLSDEEEARLRARIDALETRRYSKVLHGFHIHSWAPVYASVDKIMNDLGSFDLQQFSNWYRFAAPGATLISQNNLGTLVSTLGYSYHDRHHAGHVHAQYSGLYPVIGLSADYNERDRICSRIDYAPDGRMVTQLDTVARPAWNLNLHLSVPLVFSRGGWNTLLRPQLNYAVTNDGYRVPVPQGGGTVGREHSQVLIGTLRFETRLSRPVTRLTPRLGFGAVLSGQTRIGPEIVRNGIVGLNSWAFFPGFGREDGFKLSYARQYQPEGQLIYSPDYNLVRRPDGFESMILMDYRQLKLDYALPIYAGDIDGGFFFYLKRFIVIPFVQVAHDRKHPVIESGRISGTEPATFFSYGSALMVTTRLFRIGSDLEFGVRYARPHRPGDKGNFQFILSTGL